MRLLTIALVGLVAALNIAVWRSKPCYPAQDSQQGQYSNRLSDVPPCSSVIDRPDKDDKLGQLLSKLQDPIVPLTLALVVVGWLQRQTTEAQLATTRIIQRAWISLDTLEVVMPPQGGVSAVRISLHNSGRTPARIDSANITVWANSPLPKVPHGSLPPYDDSVAVGPPPTLLVANETTGMWFQITQSAVNSSPHIATLQTLAPGATIDLWIYGFVRYRDDLDPKTIRRYGWARRYSPIKTILVTRRTNIPDILFEHENEPGYNYAE